MATDERHTIPPTGAAPPRPRPPLRRAEAPLPVELDESTRSRVATAIAKAIASELGSVRISSVPPPSEAPRSSMRVAANYTGKGIKWGAIISGGLSFAASMIVWIAKPEYAAPLAQALKLIAGVVISALGGGPTPEASPP